MASAWPDWTCDDFPGGVEAAITQYETYGAPVSLDPDTDGTACEPGEDYAAEDDDSEEDAAAEEEDAAQRERPAAGTADADISDEPVTSLPETGSGVSLDGSQGLSRSCLSLCWPHSSLLDLQAWVLFAADPRPDGDQHGNRPPVQRRTVGRFGCRGLQLAG